MKFVTYNSQCKLYNDSELFNFDLSNLDLIFLQRCHIKLATELERLFDFKKVWTSASNEILDIGLCVLYKNKIDVLEHRVSVDIQSNDKNQCNAYQEIKYNNITIVNFLGPYLPSTSILPYLNAVWSNNFDLAIGDTHFDFLSTNTKSLLNKKYEVINRKHNFINETSNLVLSWVIADTNKLSLVTENVQFNNNKRICHFPVFFELKNLNDIQQS